MELAACIEDCKHRKAAAPLKGVSVPMPYGKVVATARLARAGRVHYRSRTHAHYEAIRRPGRHRDSQEYREPVCRCGDFGLGRYLWLLADIQPLTKPIPARGHQGLWELDLAVAA
ncbi:MAG: hypothetical protein OXG79_12305 [Chloroflexi bacterium]|nr:hypothetical protein [Chloroflexota bacterium]